MEKSGPDLGFQRELSCFLVYSSGRHVRYIDTLLEDRIETVLREGKFSPHRLGEEIRSGEDYLRKLEEVVEGCVLGVVILDGFRPNVLFEFGYLLGKGKPVIILQSRDAEINVKTLYESEEDSGLTSRRFKQLKNPRIDVGTHLSDFAGKHLAFFDPMASIKDADHPSTVLRRELEQSEEEIFKEARRVTSRGISDRDLWELIDPIADIVRNYISDAVTCDVDEIDESYSQIKSVVGRNVPYNVYSMIASTYASKAGRMGVDAANAVRCYNSAIEIYEEILGSVSKESSPIQYADTLDKVGDSYWGLSKYSEKRENCERAKKSYEEVLTIRTLDEYPEEYATIQNDLGIAYGTLAAVEDKAENCRKAIEAFNEALRVYTSDDFPMDYASTQNNFGNTYRILAEVEDTAENCRKAIEALNEALRVYTFDDFPMQYALTQNNLGNVYLTLAAVEDKAENCRKAIEAYNEALRVRTFDDFPMDYALIQNNLGNAFQTLAEVEDTAENCRKAIEALNEALRVYTFDDFPMQYALTQNNLGNVYLTLAAVEDKAENCRKAIEAYNDALRVRTFDDLPMDYAGTQNNLGAVYRTLAEVEDTAENCRKAIEALNEALRVYTFDNFPIQYAMTQHNLGSVYRTLAEVEDTAENCGKAIEALNEALRVYTEDYPVPHELVKKNLEKAIELCIGDKKSE